MPTSLAQPSLTDRQADVLQEIVRYHQATGEGASAAYLARRLELHHETIRDHLAALYRKGWLRSETSPATPLQPYLARR